MRKSKVVENVAKAVSAFKVFPFACFSGRTHHEDMLKQNNISLTDRDFTVLLGVRLAFHIEFFTVNFLYFAVASLYFPVEVRQAEMPSRFHHLTVC